MAITQYKVVKAPVQDAESVIGEWLAKGWQPLGAPVIVEPNSSSIFQAMTIGTADGGGAPGCAWRGGADGNLSYHARGATPDRSLRAAGTIAQPR